MKSVPIYQTELEKMFRYDVYTNLVERKFKSGRWAAAKAKPNKLGYSQVQFNGRKILLHRLIYTLVHGNIDENFHVDHYDGNPENNAISNLQLLSNQDNIAKGGAGINPSFDEKRDEFRAQANVEIDGKQRTVTFKRFKNKADAQKLCDAYNANFGYGKPHYKARSGTHKEWLEYMRAFKNQYFNETGLTL